MKKRLYIVPVKVVLRGESWVGAVSAEEAVAKVEKDGGDFQRDQAEMSDWTIIGQVREAPK